MMRDLNQTLRLSPTVRMNVMPLVNVTGLWRHMRVVNETVGGLGGRMNATRMMERMGGMNRTELRQHLGIWDRMHRGRAGRGRDQRRNGF